MKKQIKIIIALTLLALYLLSIFSMSVQALTIDSVSMTPNEIAPGETSTIKIGVENNADNDIQDVSINLDLTNVPFAPFDSASEYGFDEIREGKTKTASFEIIASDKTDSGIIADSGIYTIPVEITYTENEIVKLKRALISITINSEPIIGASLEDGLLLKGKENTLEIKIINKGLSNVEFLEVEIGTSIHYSLLSQKNIYIGGIDSDDFDNVDFQVYFNSKTPDRINLPITITYKDAISGEYTETFDIGYMLVLLLF